MTPQTEKGKVSLTWKTWRSPEGPNQGRPTPSLQYPGVNKAQKNLKKGLTSRPKNLKIKQMAINPEVIAAGAQLSGQFLNAGSQIFTNKSNRRFSERMADRQRTWALDDWYMQNEYNHPSNQMARLREAGLNPNLVYGNGADAQAGPVRGSDAPKMQSQAPQFDPGSAIGAYQDVQLKNAQVDNLRKQNTVIEQDALLKAAQIAATLASTQNTKIQTKSGEFKYSQDVRLADIVYEAAKTNIEKTQADISASKMNTLYTLDKNDREAAANAQSIKEGIERILASRQARIESQSRIKLNKGNYEKIGEELTRIRAEVANINQVRSNLMKDALLKDLDINLKKEGIQPGDPAWMRVLDQQIKRLLRNSDTVPFKLPSAE